MMLNQYLSKYLLGIVSAYFTDKASPISPFVHLLKEGKDSSAT